MPDDDAAATLAGLVPLMTKPPGQNGSALWCDDMRRLLEGNLSAEDAHKANDAINKIIQASVAKADEPLWTWRTMADAYADRPPIQYVVDGLFQEASLNIVYGPPGCLKSMLIADLAVCIATGKTWLANLPGKSEAKTFTTLQRPVAWVDVDNGTRMTDERMEAIGRAHHVADDAPVHYMSIPSPPIDASDATNIARLSCDLALLGVKAVVMDNLGTISGQAEENSADMVHVMANLRRLSEETGAAVIVIHHQRKANGFIGRAGETLRGHSSIEASLNLGLVVERAEGSDIVTIKATKVRGAPIEPFSAMFTYAWKDGTHDLGAARFFGVPVENDTSAFAIKRAVLETVRDQPGLNKTDLTKAVKEIIDVGINTIRSSIDELARKGSLRTQPGESTNAKVYYLS